MRQENIVILFQNMMNNFGLDRIIGGDLYDHFMSMRVFDTD